MANEFKTGTVIVTRINLSISGEVVSALPQIVATIYYVRNGQKFKFHWAAKDPSATDVDDEATAEGRTVSTIVFDGEVLVITIPIVDTDTISLNFCEKVPVLADIAYLDSASARQKAVPDKDRIKSDKNEMRDDCVAIPESLTICDYYAGAMIKGNEGWL